MYTGLIEEIGEIKEVKKSESSLYFRVAAKKVIEGLKIGDSVAINGACQTVIEMTDRDFIVFASSETLSITTFDTYKTGTKVNLERTMRLSDRLDGHLVSGHVDGTAVLMKSERKGEGHELTFSADTRFFSQIVKKGSITVDGISLTVADIEGDTFKIAVIPHTFNSTTLKHLKIGGKVNIETDMIAKYVEKYLSSNHNNRNKDSHVDMSLLERNGFL